MLIFFIESVLTILQDYIHWRRNYFPGDKILIDKKIQRDNEEESDKIHLGMMEMIAQLRRNFPFYSPRYIGHMLSDVSIPSMLGYLAGMLHNSNNCTPEAAPVTVEWEIEACNNILEMLGFNPPPSPPSKEAKPIDWERYESMLKKEYGWAHITSGGTVANIEALWIARIVKYFPLAIQDVAIKEELSIDIKLPKHTDKAPSTADIRKMNKKDLLFIKPNESIYLYSRFIDALKKKKDITIHEAEKIASELLKSSEYSLSNNIGKIFEEFPPVVFVSGTAHYSIKKAADLLGIGCSNAILVNMDTNFRMDVSDLKKKIDIALVENKIPLAVIAIAGTTEEGAVDPIHKIIDLRREYENDNKSFWMHIDSAWGGYVSTLFNHDEREEIDMLLNKIYSKITQKNLDETDTQTKIHKIVSEFLIKTTLSKEKHADNEDILKRLETFERKLHGIEIRVKSYIEPIEFIDDLKNLCISADHLIEDEINLKKDDFLLKIRDRGDFVTDYVSEKINFSIDKVVREKVISWGGTPVISSFLAFKNADSITIDPHKLGYVPYPCGVVAFKNDRVRHFIMQKAPYITSTYYNALLHTPPLHIEDYEEIGKKISEGEHKIGIDVFAPFILEGSKPGAAASALWFSSKMIPLNKTNHGLIVKESIISARELYEWITTWEKIYKLSRSEKLKYQFKTFGSAPDTNVFVFVIKNVVTNSIKEINEFTSKVYQEFSISVEQGSREHSYSQSFFLSKTVMNEENYKFEVFKNLFQDKEKGWGLTNIKKSESEYKEHGLIVLRATVMNPYIASIRRNTNQNLIKEFVWELHKCANKCTL